MTRRTLTLALAQTKGFGGKTISRILVRCDLFGLSPEEFLSLSEASLMEDYRLKPALAERWKILGRQKMEEAQRLLERLDRHGVTVATVADAHYPRQLEQFEHSPTGVLYLYGNARLLDGNTFTVCSSRKSPEAAFPIIEQAVEDGVLAGEVLVTSHDTSEYQRAAVVPLRWGSPRVLVFDTGLFRALGDDLSEEPFSAARLWRYKFDPSTDLALSPVPPFGEFHRNANAVRDRLVVALSRRFDGVWISPGGNMEKLAQLSMRAGRRVRIWQRCPAWDSLSSIGAQPLTDMSLG